MPKIPTMQEQLLVTALEEENITPNRIRIDHRAGISIINQLQLGIKYPKSFLDNIGKLDHTKKYKYVFKGGFTTNNKSVTVKRSDILKDYIDKKKCKIVETKAGLKRKDKTTFDKDYYQLIASGKFSLCPNWAGDWWDHDNAWTYRLIETCLTKSIPILFKEAPVGKNFIKDIKFFWSDENHLLSDIEYENIINYNYEKALQYWTLTYEEINILKNKGQFSA